LNNKELDTAHIA